VGAGAGAHLALELGVGQVVVVLHVLGLHGALVIDDDPGPGGEGEPVVGAQIGRDTGFEDLGLDRGEQAQFVGQGQAGGVHRQQHVGGAVGAFVLDALQQFLFLAFDAVDLDAGLLAEILVELFVGLVMAGGIEVQHVFLGGLQIEGQGCGQGAGEKGETQGHGELQHGLVR